MASAVKSFGIVAVTTLLSRVLGMVRDLLMAAFFGAGRAADIFYIAFMIPNFFRRLAAEGALSVTFVPVYTSSLMKNGREGSLELAANVFNIQTMAAVIITASAMIFSTQTAIAFLPAGTEQPVISLAAGLARIMMPFVVLVSFVSFSMGYLNSHGRFFAPSFAPVLLNIGMISGIILGSMYLRQPVYGAAAGVLAGGVMQALLQLPFLFKEGFRLKITFDPFHPDSAGIFKKMIPAVFGIAVYQVNALAGNLMAGMISTGSVSYIYYTNRLTELVLGVFVVSVGNVALPEMSRAMADREEFGAVISRAVSFALFLAVPAAAGLMVLGLPVVSVIFMRGSFTFADCGMLYRSLLLASAGIVFIAVQRVLTPAFYTSRGTRIPVMTAVLSIMLNIVLAHILMHTALGHGGISMAGSIAAAVQALLLVLFFSRSAGKAAIAAVWRSFLKMVLSAAVMSAVIWHASGFVDWQSASAHARLGALGLIITCGAAVYFLLCGVLGVEEVRRFARKIRRGKN